MAWIKIIGLHHPELTPELAQVYQNLAPTSTPPFHGRRSRAHGPRRRRRQAGESQSPGVARVLPLFG